MATSNRFKQPEPYRRAQLSEEFYTRGLQYTDQPLTEGFSRLLANFDFKAQQGPLTPRPGIRTSLLAVQPLVYEGSAEPVGYNPLQALVTSKMCPEGAKIFGQVVMSDFTDNAADSSGLLKSKAYVLTIQPEGESLNGNPPPAIEETDVREMTLQHLSPSTAYCYFRCPEHNSIHGLDVLNPAYWLVGTFAFGNSYYYFKNKATGDVLTRTIYDESLQYYKTEELPAKVLTPKEAVLWGYNMLSQDPYNFENQHTAASIQLLGVLPYDAAGELLMSPLINQNVTLTCFYDSPATDKHTFKWEWREPGASDWTVLKEVLVDTTTLADAECVTSFPVSEAIVRLTATKEGDTDPSQVILVGFNFRKDSYGSTANTNPIEYTLSKCKGMTFWNHRLVVYGPPEGRNILFASEINDPQYFAYPNGAEIFSEDILYACPFMDDLLVFTTSALYMLTLTPDGLSWSVTKVQGDLNIAERDIQLIKTIKNMLYFKSGNYYYMVVPSVKTKIGLALTPISNNITSLLDNFEAVIKELMLGIYNYDGDIELLDYNNHLDYDEIHNNYIIKNSSGYLLNFDLIYSTITRSWRFYIHQVPGIPMLYNRDAANRGELIILHGIWQRVQIEVDEAPAEWDTMFPCIQILRYDRINVEDWYVPETMHYRPVLPMGSEDASDDVNEVFEADRIYKNFQYLDTGNREINTDLKKRYREVQIKINNVSKQELRFYTDFYIDGGRRQSSYKYEIQHETDPLGPNYGLIYVERVLDEDSASIGVAPGVTMLAEDQTQTQFWTLNNSMFPDVNFWKIRVPVSGKGYTPRLILVSANEAVYELLSNSWVYKQMFSR